MASGAAALRCPLTLLQGGAVMAGPGDYKAAAAVGSARVRASHAEREQVIEMLKAAFVQGRLARDEFDARIGQALTCRTCAELAAVTCDLPAGLAGGPVRELPRWRVSNAVRWGMSGFVTPAVLAAAFAFGSLRGGGRYEAAAFVIAFVYLAFWLSVGAGLLWEWHCASLPTARMCVRCAHTAAAHRSAGSCAVRLTSLRLRGRCPCAGYVPPGLLPETADLDCLAATGYDPMVVAGPACSSTPHRAVRTPAHG